MKIQRLIPDTSIIIEGIVSDKIKNNEIEVEELIIPEAVLSELEHQANLGKDIGFLGLEEITRLRDLAHEKDFKITFIGRRPTANEIRYASLGEIDAMIRDFAWQEDATLMTADLVQAKVAEAKGIKCIYIPKKEKEKALKLETFFDEDTMSVHLKENVFGYAKVGRPGEWFFKKITDKPLSQEEIKEIVKEIIEEARIREDGFIEIERKGSTIVQLGKYRIVITKPPFSDGWEITAVRPIKKLSLQEYNLSERLMRRISEQAEGILIAGAPGQGKTTFAQALAEFYAAKKKIVKTVEAPRDLILPEEITQYAISHGSQQEIHDILLLSRPDYTIFDEMRNTADFSLFADLRLAGVGMIGVVHATNPIDAIQRFIGRIELGVIPQVIDTVIFIKAGKIAQVLALEMTVKVPYGMTEADLARPVVVVKDFETNKPEFEIYSYGEQTVVIPIKGKVKSALHKLAEKTIKNYFKKYGTVSVDFISDNECIIYCSPEIIPKVIGKEGKTIEKIEKDLGLKIKIQENKLKEAEEVEIENIRITKDSITLFFSKEHANKEVNIYIGEDYLTTTRIGKKGKIKISKRNIFGKSLINAYNEGKEISIRLK